MEPIGCTEKLPPWGLVWCYSLVHQCQLPHEIKERCRSFNEHIKQNACMIDMFESCIASPHKIVRIFNERYVVDGVLAHVFRDAMPSGNNGSNRIVPCQTIPSGIHAAGWRVHWELRRGYSAHEQSVGDDLFIWLFVIRKVSGFSTGLGNQGL